jgi:hypothetical protein
MLSIMLPVAPAMPEDYAYTNKAKPGPSGRIEGSDRPKVRQEDGPAHGRNEI